MDGQNWRGFKMDYISLNLKNIGPPLSNLYQFILFMQVENHSQLLCGRDFANERHLLCQLDV